MPDAPHGKEALAPIFSPVGVYRANGGYERYVLRIRGSLRLYRAVDLCSVGALLEIYPDIHHWRSIFPATKRRVDASAAAAWIAAECQKLGPCDLPEELRPRPIGRQKGWKQGVDFAAPNR